MLNKYQNLYKNLPLDILKIILSKKDYLVSENRKITSDSDNWITGDFNFIKQYLKKYWIHNRPLLNKRLKPKGKVFIILSYNEPFILSVVPIINALIAGNSVIIKPSKRNVSFFKSIWLDNTLVKKYNLPLKIISTRDKQIMASSISDSDCVYFFGSFENSKKIFKLCAESFTEFVPEIETADCKVFMNISNNLDTIKKDCASTLEQSFSHRGQTCQRICGLFIHKNSYNKYIKALKEKYRELVDSKVKNIIPSNILEDDRNINLLYSDIKRSKPKEVISSDQTPAKIVINPDMKSDYVNNGYFYPILWVTKFNNSEELHRMLNKRKFYLGLNIISDNKKFIDNLIKNTKFTRYTINVEHTTIGLEEGWGGRWPSGSGGYRNWLEHFSVLYSVRK